MLDLNDSQKYSKQEVMQCFWSKVAGKRMVQTGLLKYVRPLNYQTDEKTVIVSKNMPVLNLKNNNLRDFETALTQYVQTFFNSELFWANPITSCLDNYDKLIHAISTLWLNATAEDFLNPVPFINRYTNFLKDNTFEEFRNPKVIAGVESLKNCDIYITKSEQEEFQETPTAINLTIKKENFEKKMPRVAYGISDGIAYVYGIQGIQTFEKDSPEIKKVNRSRYALNNLDNIPPDYTHIFLRQEPYAYLSLFIFLSMAKKEGIDKVVFPSYLPSRYESKEGFIKETYKKKHSKVNNNESDAIKEHKHLKREEEKERNEHQRIQYSITNKFLSYVSRMECDVPGVTICETPEQTNGNLIIDISKMKPSLDSNIIFYEIFQKIENIMQHRNREEESKDR